jgi:hypothetical protein
MNFTDFMENGRTHRALSNATFSSKRIGIENLSGKIAIMLIHRVVAGRNSRLATLPGIETDFNSSDSLSRQACAQPRFR